MRFLVPGPWLSATIELAFLRFVTVAAVVETLILCRPGFDCCGSVLLWMSEVLERVRTLPGCLLGEDLAEWAEDLLDEFCFMDEVDEVAEEEAIDDELSWDLESDWLTEMVIELTDGERFI